jgi:hypothetical protein
MYFSTIEEQEKAFKRNIQQQYEINRLTGVSVKQQRESQKQLAAEAQYQLLMANLPEQMQARLRGIESQLLQFGPEFAKEAMAFMGTQGQVLRPGGMLAGLQPFAPEILEMLRAGPERFDPTAFAQVIARATRTLGPGLSQFGMFGTTEPALRNLAMLYQQSLALLRGQQGFTADGRPIDQQTRDFLAMADSVEKLFLKFNSALTGASLNLLTLFSPQITAVSQELEKLAKAPQEYLKEVVNRLGGVGEPGGPNIFGRAIERFRGASGIFGMLQAGLSTVGDLVSSAFKGVWEELEKAWQKAWAALGTLLEEKWESLKIRLTEWSNMFIQQLRSLLPSLPSLPGVAQDRQLAPIREEARRVPRASLIYTARDRPTLSPEATRPAIVEFEAYRQMLQERLETQRLSPAERQELMILTRDMGNQIVAAINNQGRDTVRVLRDNQ